jgi:hypothetical protein
MTAVAASPARSLLTYGAVAGPLWATISLAQAALRPDYDITRAPLSALSNGSLGWLQVLNFIVAGVLTILGAVGLRQVLTSKWAPRLIAVSGLGQIAAGIFVMDVGPSLTWHGYGHMAAGTVSFATLIAACYVLGRHFSRSANHPYALVSRIAGTALLAGDLWAMSGGTGGTVTIAAGAITAMLWISYVTASYRH